MIDPVVKVRVEGSVVVEAYLVWDIPEHLVGWVTAPIEVGPGWLYDGVTFSPPQEG